MWWKRLVISMALFALLGFGALVVVQGSDAFKRVATALTAHAIRTQIAAFPETEEIFCGSTLRLRLAARVMAQSELATIEEQLRLVETVWSLCATTPHGCDLVEAFLRGSRDQ
jgi:hypothetical protein